MDRYEDASRLYDLARDVMERGRFREAADHFERSFLLHPHFKTAELLGECRFELGEVEKAVMPLAAATALNRGFRPPFLLARAFEALGELDRALEKAELAVARTPHTRKGRELVERLRACKERENEA